MPPVVLVVVEAGSVDAIYVDGIPDVAKIVIDYDELDTSSTQQIRNKIDEIKQSYPGSSSISPEARDIIATLEGKYDAAFEDENEFEEEDEDTEDDEEDESYYDQDGDEESEDTDETA